MDEFCEDRCKDEEEVKEIYYLIRSHLDGKTTLRIVEVLGTLFVNYMVEMQKELPLDIAKKEIDGDCDKLKSLILFGLESKGIRNIH